MKARNGRELEYLSLLVGFAIFLSLVSLVVAFFDKVSFLIKTYQHAVHLDLAFQIILGYLCVLMWILYRKWRTAAWKQKGLEEVIASISPYGVVVADAHDTIIDCNHAFEKIFGYRSKEVVGSKTLHGLFNPVPPTLADEEAPGQDRQFHVGTAIGRKANGELIHLEIRSRTLSHTRGKVLVIDDVTEQKNTQATLKKINAELAATQERLNELAHFDILTGLLSHKGLAEKLGVEMKRASRYGFRVSAILVDCPDLTQINKTFGTAVGEMVLVHIASQLKQQLRSVDHIGRVGANEFLILLPETGLAEALVVAGKLRRAILWSPLPVSTEQIKIDAHLGVTVLPPDIMSLDQILSITRLLVERSTSSSNIQIAPLEHAAGRHVQSVLTATEAVERLLTADCFYPVCQPIVHLLDERIHGYELLARSSLAGLEMPCDVFSFSFEHNILSAVDFRCFKACLRQTEVFGSDLKIHINLFPSTLVSMPIEELLDVFPQGRPPGSICVELCEQQFISSPAPFREYVVRLKEAGILIGVDDVGFGRSSLECLIVLEPDVIKIDRNLVSGISRDRGKRRSLHRMLRMMEVLGATIVAEGIETKEDLVVVKELGVAYGQGYLWGRPERIEQVFATRGDLCGPGLKALRGVRVGT